MSKRNEQKETYINGRLVVGAIAAQRWYEMAREVSLMKDRLGKPVDAGIVETVIVLNVLGISTVASCEGHLEWGTGAPWVDLASNHPDAQRSVVKLNSEALQKAEAVQDWEEKKAIFDETHRIRKGIKTIHVKERQKLLSYLAVFYQNRHVPYDQRLIIRPSGANGRSRLESQGADCQEVLPLDLRARNLKAYQEEIAAFTAFLKQRFFAEERGEDRPVPVVLSNSVCENSNFRVK